MRTRGPRTEVHEEQEGVCVAAMGSDKDRKGQEGLGWLQ